MLFQNADFSSQRAYMQRKPSTLGDLHFNPLSLPLFQSGNVPCLLLFLLPSLVIRLFSFLLLLLCLLECFYILLVSSTSSFFLLNSLIFSFTLFYFLPHFSLTFYSLLPFFLSSFLPYSPTYSCYWSPSFTRFRTILSAILSNYFLLTILCVTFP